MKRGEKSATIRSSVRDHYREEVRPVSEHSGSGERTLYDLTPGESGMILSVGNQSGAVPEISSPPGRAGRSCRWAYSPGR